MFSPDQLRLVADFLADFLAPGAFTAACHHWPAFRAMAQDSADAILADMNKHEGGLQHMITGSEGMQRLAFTVFSVMEMGRGCTNYNEIDFGLWQLAVTARARSGSGRLLVVASCPKRLRWAVEELLKHRREFTVRTRLDQFSNYELNVETHFAEFRITRLPGDRVHVLFSLTKNQQSALFPASVRDAREFVASLPEE